MNHPKFKVGEEVILVSKSKPHFNGEFIVDKILFDGEDYIDRFTGEVMTCLSEYNGIGYLLSNKAFNESKGREVIWDEIALRKKHQPGEMSFNQLMNSIKFPIKID